jgi:hypothetical protein
MIKSISLLITMMMTFNTNAVSNDRLTNWLTSELQDHEELLYVLDQEASSMQMELNTIRVRLRATLSVEIPLLAKGKIRPEIELYYKK